MKLIVSLKEDGGNSSFAKDESKMSQRRGEGGCALQALTHMHASSFIQLIDSI